MKAPSFRSMSSHVSRTVFRFGRGRKLVTKIHRSISLEEPVRRGGEDEENADQDRDGLLAERQRGMDQPACLRQVPQLVIETVENPLLEPRAGRPRMRPGMVDRGLHLGHQVQEPRTRKRKTATSARNTR